MPDAVPHARESVLRLSPAGECTTAEEAGVLARRAIDALFDDHPAILFTGCPVYDRSDFGRFMASVDLPLNPYTGGLSVRTKATDGVSLSSSNPPEAVLSPHNEQAYMPHPPEKVFFFCEQPAERGGEIPINDTRKIPSRLPPGLIEETRRRGLRYIRRLPRQTGPMEIGWEQSFATTDKKVVERYLEEEGIIYRWENGDALRYWYDTPCFKTYRGEELWFNQLSECNAAYYMCHPYFKAQGLTAEMSQSDTAFGDGEPFSDDIICQVRAAIWRTSEVVKMEPTDIIVLDNHRVQHGRMAYVGTRKHFVALRN